MLLILWFCKFEYFHLLISENVTTATVATGQDSNDGRMPRGMSPAILPRSDSTNSMDSTSTPRGDVEEQGGIANEAERVKLGLLFQARNLDEKVSNELLCDSVHFLLQATFCNALCQSLSSSCKAHENKD